MTAFYESDRQQYFRAGDPPVEIGMRLRSSDYGAGSVVAILGIGIQVRWDKPLAGTETHMLVHDFSYVARLERI